MQSIFEGRGLAARALLSEGIGPAALTVLGLVGAGSVLMAGQVLAGAAIVPGAAGVGWVLLGMLPAALAVALPVGVLVGAVAAGQGWAEGGDWLALAASGLPARSLLGGLLLSGVLCGAAEAVLTAALDPAGRRGVRQALIIAAGELTVRPGQPVVVGEALLYAERAAGRRLEGLFVASGDTVMSARSGEVRGGGVLHLEQGSAAGLSAASPWRMTFATAQLALRPDLPRVEVSERSGAALRDLIARMEAEGRDASVERMALYKRAALPLSLPLLTVLGLPLGVRGVRPAAGAIAVTLLWWAVMRVCDQAVGSLGPLAAAGIPLVVLAGMVVVAWASWGDR